MSFDRRLGHFASLFSLCLPLALGACSKKSQPSPYYPHSNRWSQPAYGYPQARPGYTPAARPAPNRGYTLPQAGVLFGVLRPINVAALLAALPASPCQPQEVSPGNWVGFDCSAPSLISKATELFKPKGFVSGNLPSAVNHRELGLEGPMKSQGAVGTCTAVSLSTAIEHELRRMGVTTAVSAMHVWSGYRVPRMGQAGDSTINRKLASDRTWPYDPGQACQMMRRSFDSCGAAYGVSSNTGDADPTIRARAAQADGVGQFMLLGIEKIPSHNPNEIASILAGGTDLWVAFNINSANWKSRNMQNHVIQDYNATQSTGHAVVLSGYRTVSGRKQFLIHNSWGPNWGNKGYAWIGENMVRTQLRYAYRVRVANPSGAPGVPPVLPGGQPTQPKPASTGGCPTGQAMDVVWRQCMAACPNGSPPAAGLCIPGLQFPAAPPGGQPAPPKTQPSGQACPSGQAPDLITRKCTALCAGGFPAMGGLCVPRIK